MKRIISFFLILTLCLIPISSAIADEMSINMTQNATEEASD